ncbi:MAG: acetyl-CoA carboxylase carboxyltransferase subunit alpha [Chloroflexota bacterium]|nr:acetyl-CoA carboxylase carboxyltransferase subunit alpha [Chloroflexota bacterium]
MPGRFNVKKRLGDRANILPKIPKETEVNSVEEILPEASIPAHEPEHDQKHEKEHNSKQKPHSPAWERVLLARHIERPRTLDFIQALCDEFVELHGDRRYGDDAALVGGLARFEGRTVMVLGHQKGRNTKENILRNFGMPRAEGYRKALRLMEHAAKFKLPLLTFIDTPGAYPGKESEERGMSLAIAENLLELCRLPVPVIALVTGEGGSGGALAIGVADRMLMLENSIYSVASPEASATILWRDASQAPAAAEAMKITAPDLHKFGIIDAVIPEPPGGGHTDRPSLMITVREFLLRHLAELEQDYIGRGVEGIRAMLDARYEKYRKIGHWAELSNSKDN